LIIGKWNLYGLHQFIDSSGVQSTTDDNNIPVGNYFDFKSDGNVYIFLVGNNAVDTSRYFIIGSIVGFISGNLIDTSYTDILKLDKNNLELKLVNPGPPIYIESTLKYNK